MTQSQQYTKIQYATEDSAYGTEGTSYNELPRVQNINPVSENGYIFDRGLGEGMNVSNTYYGPFVSRGNIVFNITDFDFLKHWVGPKSGSGTAGDPYVLTEATNLSTSSSDLQPFSLESKNDDESTASVDYYTGCVGDDFELSAERDSKLRCSANFVAQKSGFRTSGESYTANTNNALIMIGGTWKWGTAPTALSGVQSFTINYRNNLNVDNRSLESRFMNIPKLTIRDYKITVTILMSESLSSTIITDFYGGATTPNDGSSSSTPTSDLEFKPEFVNGDFNAYLWLDQLSVDRISKPASVGGGLVQLTFECTAQKARSNELITWWTA